MSPPTQHHDRQQYNGPYPHTQYTSHSILKMKYQAFHMHKGSRDHEAFDLQRKRLNLIPNNAYHALSPLQNVLTKAISRLRYTQEITCLEKNG